MENLQIVEHARVWANDVLVWIGFGTLVGLLAEMIMPGRYRGGAIATLGMGIGGTIIGCGIVAFFSGGHRITPITFLGFIVSTAGAFVLLFFYRLLGGKVIREGEETRAMAFVARSVSGTGARPRTPRYANRD